VNENRRPFPCKTQVKYYAKRAKEIKLFAVCFLIVCKMNFGLLRFPITIKKYLMKFENDLVCSLHTNLFCLKLLWKKKRSQIL
jgi:hypothetical protein